MRTTRNRLFATYFKSAVDATAAGNRACNKLSDVQDAIAIKAVRKVPGHETEGWVVSTVSALGVRKFLVLGSYDVGVS